MTLPVFHDPALTVVEGGEVTLDGAEARHAVVVRRIRVGEQVVLTDGAGTTATCEVTGTTRDSLVARVLASSYQPEATPRLTVVQAIPKGERAELTVAVLTEVGVDRIVPWSAARSVGVWRGDRAAKSLAKWRAAAREAAKQARRSWFPEVTDPASTAEVAALAAGADVAAVLHEDAPAPLGALPVAEARSILLVVGPEGGIADDELAVLGVPAVRLGPTVLRTSTAGVAAAAAVLSRTPRWT